jgi:hypothetical protein
MTEPREVELWPCGYNAECSVPWCRRRATTILLYLDAQERPYRQTDVYGERDKKDVETLIEIWLGKYQCVATDDSRLKEK